MMIYLPHFSRFEFPIKIVGFWVEIGDFSVVQMVVFPSRFVALEYKQAISRFGYSQKVTLLGSLNCSQYLTLRTSSFYSEVRSSGGNDT